MRGLWKLWKYEAQQGSKEPSGLGKRISQSRPSRDDKPRLRDAHLRARHPELLRNGLPHKRRGSETKPEAVFTFRALRLPSFKARRHTRVEGAQRGCPLKRESASQAGDSRLAPASSLLCCHHQILNLQEQHGCPAAAEYISLRVTSHTGWYLTSTIKMTRLCKFRACYMGARIVAHISSCLCQPDVSKILQSFHVRPWDPRRCSLHARGPSPRS